jgi:hypothetical protein
MVFDSSGTCDGEHRMAVENALGDCWLECLTAPDRNADELGHTVSGDYLRVAELSGFDLEKRVLGTGHCYATSESLIAAQCVDWIQGCGFARWHVTSGQGGRQNNRA